MSYPSPIAGCDPALVPDLQQLAEPMTMGDPMRPLKWVPKSPSKLGETLREGGHEVSPNTVAKLLAIIPAFAGTSGKRSLVT